MSSQSNSKTRAQEQVPTSRTQAPTTMWSDPAASSAGPLDLDPDPPDEDWFDADLTKELPIPEVRQKRGNAHIDRDVVRNLLRKAAAPKVDELRKKRNRNRLLRENKFGYDELEKGQIRLLSLSPCELGNPDSPLRARIFSRQLDEVRGRYEALSYSWGDQSVVPREVIHLRHANYKLPSFDGENGQKKVTLQSLFAVATMSIKPYRFPIYNNLHDALMQLRGRLKDVILWVDAICINQGEDGKEEKRQQLKIMDDIYKSAANVCVWLGNGFHGSRDGMKLAREITNFQTFDRLMASGPGEKRWPELIRLLQLPWFSRRWIIQEIALAREATVHCGVDCIHWSDLAEIASLLRDRIGLLRKSFRDEIFEDVETASGFVLIAMLDTVCQKSDKGDVIAKMCNLETLVSTLLGFQATYPKDAIISVLSLARDPPQPGEEWEQELHGDRLKQLDRIRAAHQELGTANVTERANSSMFFKYQLSTRDTFIAFVTRSIYKSSLDLVCRHWAPPVLDRYGFEVTMPSWVSPLAQSPYGLAGTFKGRQNGENLVAYSPDDRRRRYNAAGSSAADIAMVDDQSPEFHVAHPPEFHATHLAVDTYFKVPPIATDGFVQSPAELPSPGLKPPSPVPFSNGQQIILPSTESPMLLNPWPVGGKQAEATHASNNVESVNGSAATGGSAVRPEPNRPTSSGQPRRSSLMPRQTLPGIERTHHLSGVLAVKGFIVGHVRDVSEVMRGGIVPGKWLERLGWDAADDDSNRVPELLWRTLVADRTPRGGHPPPWYRRACLHALHDPRKTDAEGNLHSVSPPGRDISEHSTLYLRRVESVVWNRRLFLANPDAANMGAPKGAATGTALKSGMFGIGPRGTDPGHFVCILLGCSVPVVLGKGQRKGLHRIVGEAYVHGLMDGQAMNLNAKHERFLLE